MKLDIDPGWIGAWFWRVTGAIIFTMMVFAGTLNYIVNPFKLYSSSFIPPVETNLRVLKTDLLLHAYPPPEVLIIGSSRVFSCDPETVTRITGKPAFNFGGPSAMAEDYYATLRYAREDCRAPIDTVIIGVDPEGFHPDLPVQSQGRFLPEYAKYFETGEDGPKLFTQRLLMLLSMEQTSESISSLRQYLKKDIGNLKMTYRPDGMVVMIERDKAIADGTFDLNKVISKRIRRYPERSLGLSRYKHLSETRMKFWEDFLAYCKENNIKVYAYITPYHPSVLNIIESQGGDKILGEFTEYISKTSHDYGAVFRDFMHVSDFGGDPEGFYDEIHMRKENCDVLLEHLLKGDDPG